MIGNRLAPIVTLILVVLLSSVHHGEAIVCYQCNSEYDPRCGDPFDPYTLGSVNCSIQPRLEHMKHMEPSICRKISQKVYGKIRVVRGCGYITDERDNAACMKRSGTHDVQAHYCSCTGDLCNSAESRTPSFLLPLTSLFTVVLALPSLLLAYPLAIPTLTSPYFSIA
ncbi:UPAR/Ly6 domain-containing protein crok [Nomia melanderi]|uniref:UPAR/Ly6 domain-containing protein crok n=1 Tax=Nomia melanderi TaxID=2448451 RepID=UPI001303F99E|nr:protein quiver-like [Nomia melanderi]